MPFRQDFCTGMRTCRVGAITDVLTQLALQVKRVRTVSTDETVPAFNDVGAVGGWPFARELPLQIECRFCNVGTQDVFLRHIIGVVLFWQCFDKQFETTGQRLSHPHFENACMQIVSQPAWPLVCLHVETIILQHARL